MATTRVWLSSWEWECCGDPFAVGDLVTLSVLPHPGEWVADMLGPELAATVMAEETHHDGDELARISGAVTAIHAVTIDHIDRRELRADHQPPPPPLPTVEGGWALIGSRDPWVTIRELVPGTAQLHPAPRVPWPQRDDTSPSEPPPPRGLNGYLVDIALA